MDNNKENREMLEANIKYAIVACGGNYNNLNMKGFLSRIGFPEEKDDL